jgi:hypothetical protein
MFPAGSSPDTLHTEHLQEDEIVTLGRLCEGGLSICVLGKPLGRKTPYSEANGR